MTGLLTIDLATVKWRQFLTSFPGLCCWHIAVKPQMFLNRTTIGCFDLIYALHLVPLQNINTRKRA